MEKHWEEMQLTLASCKFLTIFKLSHFMNWENDCVGLLDLMMSKSQGSNTQTLPDICMSFAVTKV